MTRPVRRACVAASGSLIDRWAQAAICHHASSATPSARLIQNGSSVHVMSSRTLHSQFHCTRGGRDSKVEEVAAMVVTDRSPNRDIGGNPDGLEGSQAALVAGKSSDADEWLNDGRNFSESQCFSNRCQLATAMIEQTAMPPALAPTSASARNFRSDWSATSVSPTLVSTTMAGWFTT